MEEQNDKVTLEQIKASPLYKRGWKEAKEDRGAATCVLFMCVTVIAGILWVMFGAVAYTSVGKSEYNRGVKETQVEAVERGVAEWRVDNVRGGTVLWWLAPDGDVKFNTELPQETNVVSPEK